MPPAKVHGKQPSGAPEPVTLRSGLTIHFSYEGRPASAEVARQVSHQFGTATERALWQILSVLALIAEP